MRKSLLLIVPAFLVIWSGLAMVLGPAAQAVDVTGRACTGGAASSAACKDSQSVGTSNPLFGPTGLITDAVQILTILVGVAAIVALIISGIRFITANGDSSSISRARSSIIYALVGLGITAIAQALISFVLTKV